MDPTFSVIVLVTDATAHRLCFTMDSIVFQVFSSYEIIVIDGQKKKHNQGIFHDYQSHISKIKSTEDDNLYFMMNEGLSFARGQYVHFLVSGEFYLFKHVFNLIEKEATLNETPELIYSGYLLRHSLSPTQNVIKEITLADLKMGRLPLTLQPFWFARAALVSIGGFKPRYELQAGFDLICRYFLQTKIRKVFIKRILTDFEYLKPSSKKIIRQFAEMLFLLWTHFGWTRALFTCMGKNYLRLVQWWLKNIKIAFWRRTV